jgi:uncharacterized membrane protein
VLFLTLAVPLALDGRWSSATWAVEGAALVWIGCRQNRLAARLFGTFLQFAGGMIFWLDADAHYYTLYDHTRFILNSTYLGGVMVACASVFATTVLTRHRERIFQAERTLIPLLFFWGVLWWLGSGVAEIHRQIPSHYQYAADLFLMGLSAVLSSQLYRRTQLAIARYTALGLLPAMIIGAFLFVRLEHPFAGGGWWAWPLTWAAFYLVCRRHEGAAQGMLARVLHVASAGLLLLVASWEISWDVDYLIGGGSSWAQMAMLLAPAAALWALPSLARLRRWPFDLHGDTYFEVAGPGIAAGAMAAGMFYNVTARGDSYPLPFLPLLNPLDLAELGLLLALLRFGLSWIAAYRQKYPQFTGRQLWSVLAGLAFIWLNCALLRSLHHLSGVPYEPEELLSSTLVETSLSIFWTVLALGSMVVATRMRERVVWLTGAGLLGVVILKLFVVDLSQAGTVGRIVSFVGVGVLMLVIGYISPLPPAQKPGARASSQVNS